MVTYDSFQLELEVTFLTGFYFGGYGYIKFLAIIFSAVVSPVQGLLHSEFSLRTGNVTKFEKIASLLQAKNRWCSRGLKLPHAHYLLPSYNISIS